ncbi:unnamed protein product [Rhizoctonia solani]|uniref:Protein kinase domain-containing protein n=1 Tax=Rhizoctonia solani TaxID=456999 RepID=A0A8H3GXN3_9AGAM|nr:unnamed protein product [Rhizoctonia solani]
MDVPKGDHKALVIGLNGPMHPTERSLDYATQDARRFERSLKELNNLGQSPDSRLSQNFNFKIEVLTDEDGQNVSRVAIFRALDTLFTGAKPDDLIVLFTIFRALDTLFTGAKPDDLIVLFISGQCSLFGRNGIVSLMTVGDGEQLRLIPSTVFSQHFSKLPAVATYPFDILQVFSQHFSKLPPGCTVEVFLDCNYGAGLVRLNHVIRKMTMDDATDKIPDGLPSPSMLTHTPNPDAAVTFTSNPMLSPGPLPRTIDTNAYVTVWAASDVDKKAYESPSHKGGVLASKNTLLWEKLWGVKHYGNECELENKLWERVPGAEQQPTVLASSGNSEEIMSTPLFCKFTVRPVQIPKVESKERKITSRMPLSEVIQHLSYRGCNDVTRDLDETKCDEYFVAVGGFGEVYRGVLRNGTNVSIKILKFLDATGDKTKLIKRTAQELYVWSKCKHPNILELTGVALFRNHIAMISPWMENGSLQKFLPEHPELNRYETSVQIADSISYLHSRGVIHGDIKGANILISQTYTPKLADFGSSWLAEASLCFTTTGNNPSISIRWAAPEIVSGEVQRSFEADIHALGMTILEVITGSPPYTPLSGIATIAKIMTNTHPTRPGSIPFGVKQADLLWSLLTSCWNPNPEARPSASKMKEITSEGPQP